jgi:hypothetical protein
LRGCHIGFVKVAKRPAILGFAAAWAAAILSPMAALADCTCRALGRDFELGRSVCLSTSHGPRLATCAMVLNNTSWRLSETPCDPQQPNLDRVSELRKVPRMRAPSGD